MLWTLLAFGVTMCVLSQAGLPAHRGGAGQAPERDRGVDRPRRAHALEADELLAEYRERLKEARQQAEEIVARARKAGEDHGAEVHEEAKASREELMEQTRRDIEAETERAIQEIRKEVADLTVLATEKVTRKTLDEDDQKRLVEEALSELDFSALSGSARSDVEEIAQVYARSLFEVAKERDKLDEVREQLGEFADALEENHDLQVFFFSPYFSTEEKKDGLEKAVSGASDTITNFLELLIEKHRMPAIFRVRREVDVLWEEENKLLPVQVTSAIELDKKTIVQTSATGEASRPGSKVELTSTVDPDILGGIVLRVGNSILDASIRNRLEQLRPRSPRADPGHHQLNDPTRS